MSDRDRLIELLCKEPLGFKTFENQYYKSTISKIADYLIANGVIVPPFEIGTKVYVITSATSNGKNLYIFEDIITHYHIGGNCIVMGFDNHLGEYSWNWDKVFLTKEEAEKSLERSKGE